MQGLCSAGEVFDITEKHRQLLSLGGDLGVVLASKQSIVDLRWQVLCKLKRQAFQPASLLLKFQGLGFEIAVEFDQALLLPVGVTGQVFVFTNQFRKTVKQTFGKRFDCFLVSTLENRLAFGQQ